MRYDFGKMATKLEDVKRYSSKICEDPIALKLIYSNTYNQIDSTNNEYLNFRKHITMFLITLSHEISRIFYLLFCSCIE